MSKRLEVCCRVPPGSVGRGGRRWAVCSNLRYAVFCPYWEVLRRKSRNMFMESQDSGLHRACRFLRHSCISRVTFIIRCNHTTASLFRFFLDLERPIVSADNTTLPSSPMLGSNRLGTRCFLLCGFESRVSAALLTSCVRLNEAHGLECRGLGS